MQVLAVLAASSKLCKEASSSYYIEGISKENHKDCQKTAVMAVRLPYSLKFLWHKIFTKSLDFEYSRKIFSRMAALQTTHNYVAIIN